MDDKLMVTKRDDRQPTTGDRVNIEQSASGRLEGRVLQQQHNDTTRENLVENHKF